MQEVWKDIEGYDNYQISSFGNVRNKSKLNVLKQQVNFKGYLQVSIKNKTFRVHRLVADAFIPKIEYKNQVNHINCIKTDNRVQNLEWVDNRENQIHARANGLLVNKKGSELSFSKRVNQINPETKEIIRTFNSLQEISRLTSFSYQNIWKCCNNIRNKANGYFWEYAI